MNVHKALIHRTPIRFMLLPIFRRIIGICYRHSLSPDGFYTIQPGGDDIPSFTIWLSPDGIVQLQKIRGRYESAVMRELIEHLDSGDTFWEVGAGWGYFSLALAEVADRVVAFEKNDRRATAIEQSVTENGFTNVDVVRGAVGEEVTLDNFPTPDVVLMDIEGWENRALTTSPRTLDAGPTWIVELHDPKMLLSDYPSHVNPQRVRQLFKEQDYRVTEFNRRKPGNYHILAKPTDELG